MGLKFGSLFKDVGAGFQDSLTKMGKKFEDTFSKSTSDKASFMAAAEALKSAGDASKAYKTQIVALEDELKKTTAGTKEESEVLTKLRNTRKDLTDSEMAEKISVKALDVEREELIQTEIKGTTTSKKYNKSITDLNTQFDKDLKKLTKDLSEGNIGLEDYDKSLKNMKTDMLKKKALAGLNDTAGAVGEGMDMVGDTIVDGITAAVPELEVAAAFIKQTVVAAFEQINELNKSLIELQRNTGGMITASRLGYDAFGNSAKGMESLKTATIAANVSVGEFADAMKSLSSGTFGQTIGTTQDLANASKDLQEYGIEAAREMKMYGADIGPSVRNLFQNFGKGIGEATKMLKDGADKARALGLNAAAFVKNFTEVTDLVGEVYFKTSEEMQKMALIATQLGVSVGTIGKGLQKMNSVTDLFSKQQKNAALGLDVTAKALSKIYALRQSGQGGEAAKLEFASLAKDLQRQGLAPKGQVSQQGIATLEAAGVTKDAIAGIQKLAMQAERTGVDVGALGDTSKLSKMQQLKLAHDEAANMTLEEQFNQITGLVKQSFIDPWAKIFGPVLKGLLTEIKPMAEMFSTLVSTIMAVVDTALAPLMEVFNQVTAAVSDVLTPLSNLFKTLQSALAPVLNVSKQMGIFIVKFIMNPFRIVGRIIGGVIDVVSKVVKVISDKLSPIFTWLSDMFSSGGGVIEDVLDGITTAYGYIADVVGGVLSVAFDVLGGILKVIVGVFKTLWQAVVKAWQVFQKYVIEPIKKFLAPVFEWLGQAIQPVIDLFKWLWEKLKDFGNWLAKWFGGKDEKASGPVATDWEAVLGKSTGLQNTPMIPTAAGTAGYVEKPAATFEEARAKQAGGTNITGGGIQNNITVTTNVDGLISNQNTIKKPV